jgi:hypothetical protein
VPSGSLAPSKPADTPFRRQSAPLVAPKRQFVDTKLGGTRRKVYIGFMRQAQLFACFRAVLVAGALALSFAAAAQGFAADYDLARPLELPASRAVVGTLSWGAVNLSPALQSGPRFSGVGLSLEAGRNWFGLVGVGRSAEQDHVPGYTAGEQLSVSGGYRWGDGQSLSLRLTAGRGTERLGLALSYDWPRYFVRLSYDSRMNLVPQDSLRFSAGMRF